MNSNQFSCLIHNSPRCCVGYWKNPPIRSNPFAGYVLLQAVRYFLRNKDNLPFLPTLWASKSEFAVFAIVGSQLQYLTDSHSAPGHQLKDQPVSGFSGSEDDFIHGILFQNSPTDGSRWPIQFLQPGGFAWASKIRILVLGDEVEEGCQLGVPGTLG